MVSAQRYLGLLDEADLVITHGGTTLVHALERSVPVLCLPWTSSEAAWAVRAEEHGAGMLYPMYRRPLEWRVDDTVHPSTPLAGHWSLPISAQGLSRCVQRILEEPATGLQPLIWRSDCRRLGAASIWSTSCGALDDRAASGRSARPPSRWSTGKTGALMLRSRRELSAVSASLREKAEHSVSGGESALIEMLGDRLVSVLRSHNTPSTLYYVRADGETYVVKVEFGRAPTLRDEIRWYRHAARRGLPRSLFITSHTGPCLSFLLLKCFGDGSTVDDLALAGESAGQLRHHVASAVDGDMELFRRTQRNVGQDHVHRLTERRLALRRSQARQFPYLQRLMDADVVTINGAGLASASRCLNRVFGDPRMVSYLTPDRVGMTFGDLHCGNILVHEGFTEVIDPRGGPLLPITYDFGKLVQSIEGGYGSIMAGRYVLRRTSGTVYELAPESVPGYASLAALLVASCGERRYLQSLYHAALHFTAMLPHHASAQEETTALYLCGVSLFDRLLARLA